MKKEKKVALVEEISQQLSDYSSIILTDFTGIDVKGITELRRGLVENAATLRVVKNTLLKRAADNPSLTELVESLDGPTALVLSNDAVSGVKVIVDFAKKDKKPSIKKALIEGSIVDGEEVIRYASLPSRPVLLAMLMSVINSPLTQSMTLMRGVLVKFLLTLEAVKKTMEEGEPGALK